MTKRYSAKKHPVSETQQHFRDSTDVNNIVRQFHSTGVDPYLSRKAQAKFGEATTTSFTEAMYNVAHIQSVFNELPSQTRAAFNNDPAQMLAGYTDPAKRDLMVAHDLMDPITEDAIDEVEKPPLEALATPQTPIEGTNG